MSGRLLADELARLLDEHGPLWGSQLARLAHRRKADVLRELRTMAENGRRRNGNRFPRTARAEVDWILVRHVLGAWERVGP